MMKRLILIPAAISSLRIAFLPLFFYFYSNSDIVACLVVLAFSAATDFLDGYIARKLRATSLFGTYYDAATDFIFVVGIFAVFSAKGYYPIWLLILITTSFVLFLTTGQYVKKIYDPIGKYIGSALYIGIVLTLLFPAQEMFSFVQFAFVGFFLISIGSRIVSLAKKTSRAM